ncbi:ASPH [Acanthosepion pharaonis]|uniref:ASPH n=1 Tax=Acanthosepion pharaonis TaxID=158019 RepID=A0A812CJ58_ACAPH|nr:ASPH [Sepia pharaonis]
MAEEHDAPVADEPEAYVADEVKAQDPQAPDVDELRTHEPEAPKDDESSSQESKSPQSSEELKDNEFEDDVEKHEIPLTEEQHGEQPEDFVEESLHPTEPESHVPKEEKSKETKTHAPEIAKPDESESENQMPEKTATPTVPEPKETVHEAAYADSTSTNEDKIYEKMSITNSVDYLIRDELDAADELLKDSPREALETFNNLLSKNMKSPRATYGRAAALSDIAKLESSNQILEQSMHVLEVLLSNPDTPDALLLKGGLDLAKKQHFRGWTKRAVKTLTFLNLRFPHDTVVQNELGVTYLLLGRNEDAKTIFQDVLKNHPRNGFAMVHLGFIIKTHDNNPAKAIPYLRDGIATGEKGVLDARFYFHLGDAYQRVGQNKQAKRVYEDGAARKLFLSWDQRSLYNVDRLTAKPWWDPEELPYKKSLETLENNWETIRDEVLSLISSSNDAFVDEIEKLREKGVWKQLTLYQRGIKARNGCEYTPRTCAILQRLPDTINCKRGQVKFSLMQPGTHVWPHCGPTNCRIRAHLGLVVPSGARIKVGNHTREWKEGKFIIFDDSFEHEVWHQGNTSRVVLIVDLWHPELTAAEKATLPPI